MMLKKFFILILAFMPVMANAASINGEDDSTATSSVGTPPTISVGAAPSATATGGFYSLGYGGYTMYHGCATTTMSCSRVNQKTGGCSCPSGSGAIPLVSSTTPASTFCVKGEATVTYTCN